MRENIIYRGYHHHRTSLKRGLTHTNNRKLSLICFSFIIIICGLSPTGFLSLSPLILLLLLAWGLKKKKKRSRKENVCVHLPSHRRVYMHMDNAIFALPLPPFFYECVRKTKIIIIIHLVKTKYDPRLFALFIKKKKINSEIIVLIFLL